VQKVAREIVSLDRLSRGRVVLGVGLGVPADAEFEAFGEDGSDRGRAQRLDESLDALTQLWRGERVDYDGQQMHVHSEPLMPTPIQQPRVPIWTALLWPAKPGPVRRAARWDGVVPIDQRGQSLTPDEIRAVRDAVGRDDDGYDVVITPSPDHTP